jgi:acetyl esterase/lipase
MPHALWIGYQLVLVGLAGLGLFLSVWIVITAPIFSVYPLSVGAPEVSPWLMGLHAVVLVGVGLGCWGQRVGRSPLLWMALAAAVAGLVLSSLPLSQLPSTDQRFAVAAETVIGKPALVRTTSPLGAPLRSAPFHWSDAFRGIAQPQVHIKADIPFATPDSVPLTLDVYRPSGQPPERTYPTLVVIHGGGWKGGSPKDNGEFNRYIAAQGYVVVALSYRLAPRYRFPAQQQDVQAAISFITRHSADYGIDPTRIVLMGRSAGAHLAMLAAYHPTAPSPNWPRFKAVISYYGPIDLTQGYYDRPQPDPINGPKTLRDFIGGTPEDYPTVYQAASPLQFANRPDLPPTLLVYGGRDHVVKVEFARSLHQQLLKLGIPTLLLEIPWAEHAFDAVFNGVSNQLALYYTERFLAWAVGE